VNLAVFAGTAGIVGTLGWRRRTAQLRAEHLAHELQQANIELARLDETERQMRALQETDRLRREVLANVSHELRTPMSSILTGTTMLMQRDSLPADLHQSVASLATEARRLNRLVSDLLDMTRIEGGIVDLRADDLDVREAIDAAIERLRRQAPARDVSVVVEPETPDVVADWQRLGQVLDNLLDNANRHSPDGSSIRVTAARSGDGQVVVHVIDSGPGVPPDLRAHVFERFARGDATPGAVSSGMGLGLAIVRGLVEAQGGRVWLADSQADGADFAFSLPIAAES
jgi:two-component system sensor histidine kinase KdpD